MPQSPFNQTSGTAIRFDAAATIRPQTAARQSAGVLIRVPMLQAGLNLPADSGTGAKTVENQPGSISVAQSSSTLDRRAPARRQSESLQHDAALQLRIDAAHLEAPSPHWAPDWLKQRAKLSGLLERKSLLAIGLIMAALVTATVLLASRPQPAISQQMKRQPDARATTLRSSPAPTIIRASDVRLPPAPPPIDVQQSAAPPLNWNAPAAANLPASLGDAASRAGIERPISLARREVPPAASRTDLQPAGRPGVAEFFGGIKGPSSAVSQ